MLRRHVAETPALITDEEEGDDLEDTLALPVEPVPDVAELPQGVPVRTRLFRDLAEGGLLAALALVDPPLRQRPGARLLPGRPDRGHHPAAVESPHQHPACRELPFHDLSPLR